jgi:SAM-dependent methyltransferase
LIPYDKFAYDYHHKRKWPWKDFVQFYKEISGKGFEFQGTIIDLGCANGRHFQCIKDPNNRLIGIDSSIEFLNIAKKNLPDSKISQEDINKVEITQADMNFLPFRSNSIDGIVSVAAIHHIKTKESRNHFYSQISKILKKGGCFLFSVWRRWQKRFYSYFLKDWIKRKVCASYRKKQVKKGLYDFGDIYVPWTLSSEDLVINRFYHLYSSNELKEDLKNFNIQKFEKGGGPGGKDNLFVFGLN